MDQTNNNRLYLIIRLSMTALIISTLYISGTAFYSAIFKREPVFYSSIIYAVFAGILLISAVLLAISMRIASALLKEAELHAEKLSVTDDLTSLVKRHHFLQKVKEEVERAKRYKYSLSLIIADVDSFNVYNKKFGLIAGDTVLKNIAYILKPSCRVNDTVARYGDRKFSILLPHTDDKGSITLAEKLRNRVEEYKYSESGMPVTITLGISSIDDGSGLSFDQLIEYAEEALRKAKEFGNNNAMHFKHID